MKKYSIIEIISEGMTKQGAGNTPQQYFSLRLTPLNSDPLNFKDGTTCVLNVFADEHPKMIEVLSEHKDDKEILDKLTVQIVTREYTADNAFYTNNKDGVRRTYLNPKHKDAGKDVVANKIKVVILDTEDDETNDVRCEEAFDRQVTQIQQNDMLVDLSNADLINSYKSFKARKALGLLGVDSDSVIDTTDE